MADAPYLYITICSLLFGSVFGLPIPEDFTILAAGVFVNRKLIDPATTFALCYLCIVIGDHIAFFAGRLLSSRFGTSRLARRLSSSGTLRNLRGRVVNTSFFGILLARHVCFLRTITFLSCGAAQLPVRKFFVFDAISAAVSVSVFLALGAGLSSTVTSAGALSEKARMITAVLAGAGAGACLVYFLATRRRNAAERPTSHPREAGIRL